ncbi:MAG: hypothetical protein ABF293_12550 [Flavobacteriaceae bacterium]
MYYRTGFYVCDIDHYSAAENLVRLLVIREGFISSSMALVHLRGYNK